MPYKIFNFGKPEYGFLLVKVRLGGDHPPMDTFGINFCTFFRIADDVVQTPYQSLFPG